MLCVLIFYCVRKNEEDPLVAEEVNDALNKARNNFPDIFYKDSTIRRSTQPAPAGGSSKPMGGGSSPGSMAIYKGTIGKTYSIEEDEDSARDLLETC